MFATILAISLVVVIFIAFSLSTALIFKPTPTVKPTPNPTVKPTPTPTPTYKPTPSPAPTSVPKTEILSIDGAAFGQDLGTWRNVPIIWADTNQTINYFAAVYLPNNAVITKVAFSVNDNSTRGCAQLWLMEQPLSDEGGYRLCALNSTDSQGTLRYNAVSTNWRVDNSQSAYFLELIMPATPSSSGTIHFNVAQITYTYYP